MKNIHIIPTDKPTGIFESKNGLHFSIIEKIRYGEFKGFHIYITNDEKIKKRDWYFNPKTNKVNKVGHYGHYGYSSKKIILTTDQDLIKDGVQEIDDTFLEWFVKNPSCERVEVKTETWYLNKRGWQPFPDEHIEVHEKKKVYKIIIPQKEFTMIKGGDDIVFPSSTTITLHKPLPDVNWESDITNKVWDEDEPKQIKCYCGHTITCDCEPLQETIEEFINQSNTPEGLDQFSYDKGLEDGAKWQQERMYSEEDMINFAHFYFKEEFNLAMMEINKTTKELLSEWFEQNKKKFG
jgi:hypothetical protein